MTRPNAFDPAADFSYDDADPEGYRAAEAPFGKAVGGKQLNVRLFEIPSGEHLCPYHYEYEEEWLIVMVGQVEVRSPAGIESVKAGDVVCFPAGPQGAHKIWNERDVTARVVMFSADATPSVCVYPDSDKVGIWTSDSQDKWMFRGAEGHLEYYDGEPPVTR
jgi:uncharacterized cupin superfamily protein